MKYYDRFTGRSVTDLPSQMDLGRFVGLDNNGQVIYLTNIEVSKLGDHVVRESLFDETNQNIHELLRTIATNYMSDLQSVTPIIQEFNVEIKTFEKLLIDNKSHLQAMVARPHSLLQKNIIKVNIGRAKRLSTRSYQYLAHHSEDWEKISAISPKPRKVLHEELTINHLVYENVLLKAFLHEAIRHLNKRIKETADITKFFLTIFHEGEFDKVWGDKINRMEALVGKAQKCDRSNDSSSTNRILSSLRSELVKIEHNPVFDEIPNRLIGSVVYHDTNVLISHKHYKYLKKLWRGLENVKIRDNAVSLALEQQQIMRNMSLYVQSLFAYILREMKYRVNSDGAGILAEHDCLPKITIVLDPYDILRIRTEHVEKKIVVLGGLYSQSSSDELPNDTLAFCFSDFQRQQNNKTNLFFVNPVDTYSIECSGHVVRKMIMEEYAAVINHRHPFAHMLKDFVGLIDHAISFDRRDFTYMFKDTLPNRLDEEEVIARVKKLREYTRRNYREQNSLITEMEGLVRDINDKCKSIEDKLVCPKCHERYRQKHIRYLECDCGFVCDISNEKVRFSHRQKESAYSDIKDRDWGLDFIE